MSITTVNAIDWARASSGRFFPAGKPDPIYLLMYLMADVLELGGGSCSIRRSGSWWIIGSDNDWFSAAPCPDHELFNRVVPAPRHGEHSMRGEILVAAFSPSVWTVLGGKRIRVQGAEPDDAVWAATSGSHRAIVFYWEGRSDVSEPGR